MGIGTSDSPNLTEEKILESSNLQVYLILILEIHIFNTVESITDKYVKLKNYNRVLTQIFKVEYLNTNSRLILIVRLLYKGDYIFLMKKN